MALPHLPEELAKIRRKNRARLQIVGIGDHAKTRVIAGFQSSEVRNGRTNVKFPDLSDMSQSPPQLPPSANPQAPALVSAEPTTPSEQSRAESPKPKPQPLPAAAPAAAVTTISKQEAAPQSPSVPTRFPQITFLLPNAKVGQPYEAELVQSPADAPTVRVLSIAVAEGYGIAHVSGTKRVVGTPLKDGDCDIGVTYRFTEDRPDAAPRKAKARLTVIADPRSLWKNLPSDRSDPFWKSDSHTQVLRGNQHTIVAASQRGRSHAHKGTFRDDDFFIEQTVSGWSVAIVADGAGSALFSRRGSLVASRSAGHHLSNLLAGEDGEKLTSLAEAYATGRTSQDEQALRAALYQTVGHSAYFALRDLLEEVQAKQSANPDINIRQFDTTLLVAACRSIKDGLLVGTYWVGDGAIAVLDRHSGVTLCGKPDSGEFSGGTRFLGPQYVTQESLWERTRFFIVPRMDALMLMTDGVSDPKFPSESALSEAAPWNALWEDIDAAAGLSSRSEGMENRLLDWLDFWSAGEHDDRTIAIVW